MNDTSFALQFLITYFVFAAIMGVLCAWVASERGRSAGSWFFLGLLLGVFAFIPLALAPARPRAQYAGAHAPSAAEARQRIRAEQGSPPRRRSPVQSPIDQYVPKGQRQRNRERLSEIQERRKQEEHEVTVIKLKQP